MAPDAPLSGRACFQSLVFPLRIESLCVLARRWICCSLLPLWLSALNETGPIFTLDEGVVAGVADVGGVNHFVVMCS